ncbi:orotidine-5'-phosphate decarboxylase [Microvirga sp. VF16]|uniref:orotidine-5'-phosphate decarboxylase n=1 Tax=Microvirga sp. VF16 TaxID=2807101 RepID=UPI00193E9987|nr:orotidine-5'-phosphate decarboxylase [Microvirga sp. VF16]QRM30455.1 orotidine-5'-phosphate decarboxylase [Microvirga sp. VF16]
MSLPTNSASGDIRDKLIIGLDVASVEEARSVVLRIGDAGTFYKIGYQLAYAGGFEFARELIGQGKKVFLDLKLHDIGNTVEEGVRSVARLGATFLTVHAYPQTMRSAVAGKVGTDLKILAVTVLTSYDDNDLVEAGYAPVSAAELVARRAGQARDLGIDGIVCAATEAERVRSIVGPDRLIVTPGIRPAGADAGDQKRVVTPAEGIRLGANHLVVARPIVKAADPRAAAEAIVREIAQAS